MIDRVENIEICNAWSPKLHKSLWPPHVPFCHLRMWDIHDIVHTVATIAPDDCETAWKSTQNNLDLRFQSRRSPSILHVWLPWSRIRFVEKSIVAVPVGGWFGGHSMSRGGGTCKVCLFSIESSAIGRKILEGAKKHCWVWGRKPGKESSEKEARRPPKVYPLWT